MDDSSREQRFGSPRSAQHGSARPVLDELVLEPTRVRVSFRITPAELAGAWCGYHSRPSDLEILRTTRALHVKFLNLSSGFAYIQQGASTTEFGQEQIVVVVTVTFIQMDEVGPFAHLDGQYSTKADTRRRLSRASSRSPIGPTTLIGLATSLLASVTLPHLLPSYSFLLRNRSRDAARIRGTAKKSCVPFPAITITYFRYVAARYTLNAATVSLRRHLMV